VDCGRLSQPWVRYRHMRARRATDGSVTIRNAVSWQGAALSVLRRGSGRAPLGARGVSLFVFEHRSDLLTELRCVLVSV
jgi:hypothetical protein